MSLGKAFKAFFTVLKGADLIPRSDLEKLKAEMENIEKEKLALETKLAEQPDIDKAKESSFEEGAVYTLNLLQRDGRLIDFLQEKNDGYSNEQIGTAVRRVHGDCAKVLNERFAIEAVRSEAEGESITLNDDFDPAAVQLTGNVPDSPPYKGQLSHKGWKATKCQLPKRQGKIDPMIIKAAEVEVP